MKNYRNKYILLSMLFLIVFPTITHAQSNLPAISWKQSIAPEKNYVEGEIIVKYKDTTITTKIEDDQSKELLQALSRHSQSSDIIVEDNIDELNVAKITSSDKTTQELITELSENETVELVEPNYIKTPSFVPNDTYFSRQWAHRNTGQSINEVSGTNDADIDTTEMWDIVDSESIDTIVAVIDSGVNYTHTELSANMWDGASCVDENNNTISGGCPNHGWNYVNDNNDPNDAGDEEGHGTLASSILASNTNNSTGGAGISRYNHIKIMAIRFDFNVFSELKAIDFARHNGAKVINASFGGSQFSQIEKDAIDTFPGIVVTASGNGGNDDIGDNNDITPSYPCNYTSSNIICVAATDQDDNLADFSNYGSTSVDIAAPGVRIFGIYQGSYVYGSGTSFSTPLVSGVASILYSHNNTLTNTQIRNFILTTDDDKASLSGKIASNGRLNAFNALSALSISPGFAIPPRRSNGAPSGELPKDTTITTLSLTTNEDSICKYSTISNQNYASMPNTFSITNSTSHSTILTGLTNGTNYIYYVRCEDSHNNQNNNDYIINFSILTDLTPTYRFYSQNNRSHFYTTSETEKDYIIATYSTAEWYYEGVAYYVPTTSIGNRPVYRFYSQNNKSHFFTVSESEKDHIIATYPTAEWYYEGIAYYVLT